MVNEADQAAHHLSPIPGTAELDFGEAPFIYGGDEIVLPFLVMSFPNSNGFYFQVFPSQNKECFLEGLREYFIIWEECQSDSL